MTNNKDLRIEMIEILTNKNPKQAKSIISRTRRITQNTKSNNKKVGAMVMEEEKEETADKITAIEMTANKRHPKRITGNKTIANNHLNQPK